MLPDRLSSKSGSDKPMAVEKGGTLAGKPLKQLCDEYVAALKEYKEFQLKVGG